MTLNELLLHPSKKDLRTFGVLQFPFALLTCWWLARKGVHVNGLWSIVAISLLILIVGVRRPSNLRWLYVAWIWAVFPIGWAVSHLLMAVVYYGVVTPVGLFRRWRHGDPLQRAFDSSAETYWVKRSERTGPDAWFRQF